MVSKQLYGGRIHVLTGKPGFNFLFVGSLPSFFSSLNNIEQIHMTVLDCSDYPQ